jgi:5-methylcytosine-specific restriction protein A
MSELDGKRLYAQTLASFMASQRIDDPFKLNATAEMPVRVVDFLLREIAVKYWRKNYWLRPDPFNENYRLTQNGEEKILERLTGAAGAQSVSVKEVLAEYRIVVGQVREEPLAEFEYTNGAFAMQSGQSATDHVNPDELQPEAQLSERTTPAYLLTWNPKNWQWNELPEIAHQVANGLPVDQRWSCGNSRSIAVGSRVFLLRQGVEPKGIVASGWVTKAPFAAPHWDAVRATRGEQAFFIMFTADALLNPSESHPLDVRAYTTGPLAEVQLDAPASGNSIPYPVAIALSEAWAAHLGKEDQGLGKGDPELGAMEGEQERRFVSHRGRERALRVAKLEQARANSKDGHIRCEVRGCDFDFEAIYGSVAEGFAHVHHLRPLAEAASPRITKLEDLAVVCANCHAVIHRGGACRPIETLIPTGRR